MAATSTEAEATPLMPNGNIDVSSGVPLYRQIKDILRSEILQGHTDPHRPMTEAQLLDRFNVSRAPIRQALKELTSEGFVYRKQGKGTFPVPGARVERPASIRSGGLYEYLEDANLKPTSSISDLQYRVPPAHVQEALNLSPDEEIMHFMRIISVEGAPFAEVEVYVRTPADFNPTLKELEEAGSAFTLLDRQYGILLERADHAASATAATADQARTLGVPAGSPLLVIESTFFITGGVPAGWRSAAHGAEKFKYRFTSDR
ncbi:MAG: GntR family transcriptional regulator [Micrococcaceae bacterium]